MTCEAIQIWGDSIARGVTYNETRERYALSPERAALRLRALTRVEEHAVMGATVEDGLSAFLPAPRVENAVCAIEYGGNDCDLDWAAVASDPDAPMRPRVPLDRYTSLLTKFVIHVRSLGMRPLLVTPPPLNSARYFRWVTRGLDARAVLRALGDVGHIGRWQERYHIAMRNVAQATATPILDLRDAFLARKDPAALLSLDGIHPNGDGYRLISDAAQALYERP